MTDWTADEWSVHSSSQLYLRNLKLSSVICPHIVSTQDLSLYQKSWFTEPELDLNIAPSCCLLLPDQQNEKHAEVLWHRALCKVTLTSWSYNMMGFGLWFHEIQRGDTSALCIDRRNFDLELALSIKRWEDRGHLLTHACLIHQGFCLSVLDSPCKSIMAPKKWITSRWAARFFMPTDVHD